MTDSELQSLLKKSEKAGHTAIFTEYFGYVYAIVYSKLRSFAGREDMEECVSDVFADVFRYISCHKGGYEGDIKGYISTIANRKAIDTYRRLAGRTGRTVPLDSVEELSGGMDVEEYAEHTEQSRMLMQCIEALGEPDAAIIIQKFYYGRKSGEIAKALSMKPATVRMRCSRALKALKKRLTELGIEG